MRVRRPALAALAALAAATVTLTACSSGSSPAVGTAHPSASASHHSDGSAAATVSPAPTASAPPVSQVVPRIEAFVQKERGLRFKHPVKVTLLANKAFVAKLRAVQKRGSSDSTSNAASAKATLSALGLISPKTNLSKAFGKAYDVGTLGFYDDRSKQLYVRGARATPGVQAVLSHELTHALTDQWFDLTRPALRKDKFEKSLAFTGLIEGDAERTRMAFEAQLSPDQRALAQKEESAGGTPKGVPTVVLELIGLPYIVGPQFVAAIVLEGGIPALNEAYRNPPVSSEQLLDPDRYTAHDQPRIPPFPAAGGTVLDRSDLGEVGLLLMLESRLTHGAATQAAQGWGGDAYVTWRDGSGRYCLRDAMVMDSATDVTELDAALREWVSRSGSGAKIEKTGTTTVFLSCSAPS